MVVVLTTTVAQSAEPISFNRDIRPILSDSCFACHGPDAEHREADLRLDLEAAAKENAISEKGAADSELWRRIISKDSDEQMPPPDSGKSLTSTQVDLIKRWLDQGADYEPFWAYVPPKQSSPPPVKDSRWPLNHIDRYLLSRLEAEQLSPSPEAYKRTLLRRLSFDLTGLPPSMQELQSFLSDDSPGAYERVVDRLLASDRYGERMAMYWLDLVRFADTVGYHGDQDHHISPYRDYVIDSFNRNLPFDQFTREQLAGDFVAAQLDDPSNADPLIASGYNRLLQTSHEGGVQKQEYLAIYAADRVRNISNVWLGGTLGCAQCHDHKYDPYTTKDFYAMAAFFADIDDAEHLTKGDNALPTRRAPQVQLLTRQEREKIARLEGLLQNSELTEQQQKQIKADITSVKSAARTTMITVSQEPRITRVLPRGNWLDESGQIVAPATPEFLPPVNFDGDRATRLDLANWLTDPKAAGPLTARVFANRFWYLLFGVGLSKSLDDFGGQGEAPMHPQLLDALALEFLSSGWNVKQTIKQMVMSRAYRQTSHASPKLRARDPYNRLVARQGSFRLPAEMVRDNALAISGLLVHNPGGASIKPYQPAGYYRHLNFPQRKYAHHTDDRQWRRGVYMHWQRQFLHPMLKAFDAPSREECVAQRPQSNTPLAALTLLNDPTFVEAARVFASVILDQQGDDASRLSFAMQRTLGRKPDTIEQQIFQTLLDHHRTKYKANPAAAKQLLQTGQATFSDKNAAEQAAWTAVARALLNLHETTTRF